MAMTDPIADLLTRIRNGAGKKHEKVEIPASRIKANIVRVLKEEGFIRNFRLIRDEAGNPIIKIYLKYGDKGDSVIRGIRRVSKPGLRRYGGYQDLHQHFGVGTTAILSTSKGVITGRRALDMKLGGEVLCAVW